MANVDSTEIAKFDRLADHWWNPSGALGALHRINPLRLRYISQRTNLNGATVLGYNLFTARYFLTTDTRVNYMAHFKRIH